MPFVAVTEHDLAGVVGGETPTIADDAASLAGQFAKMRALPGCIDAAERAQDQSVLASCLAKAAEDVANPMRARVNKIPTKP